MIGGFLSRPAERFPDVFGNSEFLKVHPYFLACAVPATFSAIAWLVTLTCLNEVRTMMLSVCLYVSHRFIDRGYSELCPACCQELAE